MSSNNEDYICYECSKRYPDFGKYQAHFKLKHRDNRHPQKINLNQEQLFQVQDKIYTYFGELSQIYSENTRTAQPENLLQQPRFIGQANYLPNFIVRTPYEPEINVPNQIPTNFQLSPVIKISLTKQQRQRFNTEISGQIKQLHKKLEEQRNFWEFTDPFDNSIDFQDQFSVLDVYKLIKNYPKRNINLKMPYLSIFLVWIGRVCKSDMFKLAYEILVSYMIYFEDFLRSQKLGKSGRKSLKNWQRFRQRQAQLIQKGQYIESVQYYNQKEVIRLFQIKLNVNKIELTKLDRLIFLFQKWIETVLPAFSGDKRPSKLEQQ